MEVTGEKKLHFKIQPISALPDYTCECTIFSLVWCNFFYISLFIFFHLMLSFDVRWCLSDRFSSSSSSWERVLRKLQSQRKRTRPNNEQVRQGLVITLAITAICTFALLFHQKSFDCWFFFHLCSFSIVRLLIIEFFMLLFFLALSLFLSPARISFIDCDTAQEKKRRRPKCLSHLIAL